MDTLSILIESNTVDRAQCGPRLNGWASVSTKNSTYSALVALEEQPPNCAVSSCHAEFVLEEMSLQHVLGLPLDILLVGHGHLKQRPEPLQLSPFDAKEQWLYCALLPSIICRKRRWNGVVVLAKSTIPIHKTYEQNWWQRAAPQSNIHHCDLLMAMPAKLLLQSSRSWTALSNGPWTPCLWGAKF